MTKQRARELRKSMTRQEVGLWLRLRDLRPLGFHFRRQAPIGPYIVDFACKSRRLVVELDGGQHGMAAGLARDAARDRHLAGFGFTTLRFWNVDVDRNIEGVLETIMAALEWPPPDPAPPGHPPPEGEG